MSSMSLSSMKRRSAFCFRAWRAEGLTLPSRLYAPSTKKPSVPDCVAPTRSPALAYRRTSATWSNRGPFEYDTAAEYRGSISPTPCQAGMKSREGRQHKTHMHAAIRGDVRHTTTVAVAIKATPKTAARTIYRGQKYTAFESRV